MATSNPLKVVTGKVRLSYAHLFEPSSSFEGQDEKYSTVLLIPKTDKETIKKIRDAQVEALEKGRENKFGGKIPKIWKDTLRDGDEEADLDRNPEYKGHMFLSCSSKVRPGLVDRDLNPIMDQTELYSGVYARVSMNAFPFSVSGNKGVSFGLNNVQKISDGESLGGASAKPEDDFDELDDEDLL